MDEALRQRMSSELKALEETLHSALMALSAAGAVANKGGAPAGSKGAIASGDMAFVEVELALRAVQNGALELAAILPNR